MASKTGKGSKGGAAEISRDAVVDAALALAAEGPWERVRLSDIAARAGTDLATLRREFPGKTAILSAFGKRVDEAVLAGIDRDLEDEPARERLFDIMVARFDYLKPHRAAARSVARAMMRDPASALEANRAAVNSMVWMMEAAGIDASGGRGRLRAQGLVLIAARTMRVFIDDDDPGLARTMAALDRHLNEGERIVRRGEDACRLARGVARFAGSILRGGRRRGGAETVDAGGGI